MYNWEGISEFVAVADTGSFTAAADKLGVSTAHVSRQVSKLEQRLAVKLLYRTTRKVSLSEDGRSFFQQCRTLLEGLEDAERALSERQGMLRGKLRLTAPVTLGERAIAPLVNQFLAEHPELEITLRLTNQPLDLVEGGYDLAIRLGKLESSSMMARKLAPRIPYVCASPDYLARCGVPNTLAELEQHNCLLGTLDYWRFQVEGRERVVRVRGNLSCNSGHALLDAALQGLGIVQLPDYYVENALAQGRLVSLLAQYRIPDEGIWALYPNNRQLSPKVRQLLDHFAKAFENKLI
ncbi:LysR family transcriptional regulator [Neptunomonas marina]|uniref:LysR family transcriptional regulator n=1 Tax=Neptunomonas marina TaxID=1815562 RepID=A0A437QB38_9GAMM|nr:LysR family transcriptional regulator [Neptunomonas marina]RVU31619.1 LysR family transcriptional regulator [Neptunomonas marina]